MRNALITDHAKHIRMLIPTVAPVDTGAASGFASACALTMKAASPEAKLASPAALPRKLNHPVTYADCGGERVLAWVVVGG